MPAIPILNVLIIFLNLVILPFEKNTDNSFLHYPLPRSVRKAQHIDTNDEVLGILV